MQTMDHLSVLDGVYALMVRARAISAVIKGMDIDIAAAREAGLLTAADERFFTPHAIACTAAARAHTALRQVLAACDLQPELLEAPGHQEALALAARSLSLAFALVGDTQEHTDSMGPEDHL